MFKLNFKEDYKILHLTNEFGKYIVGGVTTYINEIYKYHTSDMGFVYFNESDELSDIDSTFLLDQKDIAVIHPNESDKLNSLYAEIVVIHLYHLINYIDEDFLLDKEVVYVVHSIPVYGLDPENDIMNIRENFEKLCNLASKIVCISDSEKDKFCELYPEFEEKVSIIYNGIDTTNLRTNENYMVKRKTLGYIGRTEYRKGVLELLKAIKDLDYNLLLACPCNDANYIDMLDTYIAENKMENKVRFCGFCTGERKDDFFKKIDALVIPSLYEPFGYTALEGMVYGVPIISSNEGGLGTIFRDYKYTYDPQKPSELYKLLKQFKTEDSMIIGKELEKLKTRLNYFSSSNMYNKYIELYSQILI